MGGLGVKPILAMPGFSRVFEQPPLPKCTMSPSLTFQISGMLIVCAYTMSGTITMCGYTMCSYTFCGKESVVIQWYTMCGILHMWRRTPVRPVAWSASHLGMWAGGGG